MISGVFGEGRPCKVIIIIIIFSSLALEVTHKKARPVQSVLTQAIQGNLLESNGVGHYKS